MSTTTTITTAQAQELVHRHCGGRGRISVSRVTELVNRGFSYSRSLRTFAIDLAGAPAPCCSFLTIDLNPDASSSPSENLKKLTTIHNLIQAIREKTSLPVPLPFISTTPTDEKEGEVVFDKGYAYLLSPPAPGLSSPDLVSLAEVRRKGLFNALGGGADGGELMLRVEDQIGKLLGQLHANVQNEFFGAPGVDDATGQDAFSWQETFVRLLEGILEDFEGKEKGGEVVQDDDVVGKIPFTRIRQSLSKAIGSFLFSDVEVPSLVWCTGSEEDIYVVDPSSASARALLAQSQSTIAALLPNLTHALWGDPLMETFFLPPNPSKSVKEGYELASGRGEGNWLVQFERQKTKRLWYTLYLALIVLRERRGGVDEFSKEKKKWALDIIEQTVDFLKDAPTN